MRVLILPLLVPFLTAIVVALLTGRPVLQKIVSVASALGLTAFVFWLLFYVDRHGIQTMVVGGWTAPWGIAFVADRLRCIMLCLSMAGRDRGDALHALERAAPAGGATSSTRSSRCCSSA